MRLASRADAAGDRRPGVAVVVGAVDVRLEVVLLIPVGGDVRRAGTERRRFDQADARELAEIFRRHVLPRRAAVARHLHVPVVGAGPDEIGVFRRRRNREHGRVGLDAGVVLGDRTARRAHRLRIVARQVGADARPALAFVGGLPDVLRADVERARIGGREHDRERPLEALGDVSRRIAHRVVGMRVDRALLAGAPIEPRDEAAVAAGEEQIRRPRIAGDVAALAAADRVEDLIDAARSAEAGRRLARKAGGAVVLLRAADVIRHVPGRNHVVHLRGRHRLRRPRFAAVH